MLNKIFNRQSRLEHPDAAQRVLGLSENDVDAADIERLLRADPAPEVRKAAASRCAAPEALVSAVTTDADSAVREVASTRLAELLSTLDDDAEAATCLSDERLPDAIRAATARRASQAGRRKVAVDAIRDEQALVSLALDASHTDTRMAAAERVTSEAGLQKLQDGARNKDHGVARLAKQRLDAMRTRSTQGAEADAVLGALEALADEPGPILTAVVELNRRWQALDLSGDTARLARCDAARQAIQARFDREQEQQRAKAQYERRLRDWMAEFGKMTIPPTEQLIELRTALAALRDEARGRDDSAGLARTDEAEARIAVWEAEHVALAGAEALVEEAERLAADTSIDDAQLPTRWQALDRSTRTPDLTRRFEAALMTVEQRRLAQVQATQQQASAAKLQLHGLLHNAEQALAAGTLQPARAALDEIRGLKTNAGLLPKPTVQRLSRAIQQLNDLERWESFGQQTARVQLCERAEALAATTSEPGALAQEVQKLRNEWKALDDQFKGVPKALWERFDRACEKAYAPAARHFAELAQQRKDARKRREDFIAQTAAHAPTVLTDPPDWKAVERWLREADHGWHEADLGSVDPGTWKKLEVRFRAALAPARDAIAAARAKVKAEREALIAEATALKDKALERDTPSQVKAIQQRWQDNARQLALAQRDERALWEQFRAACDSVFNARQAKRSEDETKKSEHRRALEAIAADLEQLAQRKDASEQDIKRGTREAQDKWKTLAASSDPALREVEPRFRRAKVAVDGMLADRSRQRESAVWLTLVSKEKLCETLDRAIIDSAVDGGSDAVARVDDQWSQLPDLLPAWEKQLQSRRDAAKRALADPAAGDKHRDAIARSAPERRQILLELELVLGLDSPKELQGERLALQVRQLKERFKSSVSVTPETAGERFVSWSAMPGVVEGNDRSRSERLVSALDSVRARAPSPPPEVTISRSAPSPRPHDRAQRGRRY